VCVGGAVFNSYAALVRSTFRVVPLEHTFFVHFLYYPDITNPMRFLHIRSCITMFNMFTKRGFIKAGLKELIQIYLSGIPLSDFFFL